MEQITNALRLTDSHCHLDEFEDINVILRQAEECGVTRMVAVSQNKSSMQRVLDLAAEFPCKILPALGIHPCCVTRQTQMETEKDFEFLTQHLKSVMILGEAGLDYKWAETHDQKMYQQRLLERQFELAAQHNKPLNLHARLCLREVMDRAISFRRETGLNVQLHWFTHSKKLAYICNDEGIFISVGPSIIFQEQNQAVAMEIDENLLLLETDAPVPIGGPGHPRRTHEVATKLAEMKNVSLAELAGLTEANFSRFISHAE